MGSWGGNTEEKGGQRGEERGGASIIYIHHSPKIRTPSAPPLRSPLNPSTNCTTIITARNGI